MTANEILRELAKLGSEATKRTHIRHGAQEPLFGVKVGDLKVIQKRIKKHHGLSLELFETGNSDAMYLAGLIADENRISPKELKRWAEKASWSMISNSVVAPVAAESSHGWDLALEWIDAKSEKLQATGWSTLCHWVSITPDADLDKAKLKQLLRRVEAGLSKSSEDVQLQMNGFVIAVGGCVPSLTQEAKKTARALGKVTVDMGDTACKVPDAFSYIEKIEKMGRVGKKKKVARC